MTSTLLMINDNLILFQVMAWCLQAVLLLHIDLVIPIAQIVPLSFQAAIAHKPRQVR